MMGIDGRPCVVQLADQYIIAPDEGVYHDEAISGPEPQLLPSSNHDDACTNEQAIDDFPTPTSTHAAAAAVPVPVPVPVPSPLQSQSRTQHLPAQRHGRGVD